LSQNTSQDETQPGFALCTPVISIDEIHVNKRKRKKSKKRNNVRSSKSLSEKHSKSRSKKRRRKCKRKRKHCSNSRSADRKKRSKRCKNKMCVKHAETDSIPNLLVDKLEDPPCKNKLCAKHNNRSTSEAEAEDLGENKADDDLDTSSSESSSDSDDESESSEEDSNENSKINTAVVPKCRRPKTIIRRILEFLGLQRRTSNSQECSCSTCGGRARKNKFSEKKQACISTAKIAGSSRNESETPEPCCSNECGCPYCPLKISDKLDLDNIMVPKECGDLISESIREVVCKEIEFRLKGLEDSIVEEERQFWATYIPRDRCPRCCSGQQCDLHGSLGCVPCFSSKYGANKC
jgi:hypothetical protein